MKELISIIVPVYNTAEYLGQCIESICAQTYEKIEIILVDDGSIDGSGDICDQYQRNDERIKVIHQENQGAAEARVVGIKSASGRIVSFVDSDDWIEKDMYENMMQVMKDEKVDFVGTAFYMENDNKKVLCPNTLELGKYDGEEMIDLYKKMVYYESRGSSGVLPSLCMKLLKREIVLECMELVDRKLTFGDDAAIVYPYLLKSKNAVILNDAYYRYTVRETSICHANDLKKFEDIYEFHELMKKIFSSYDNSLNLQRQLYQYTFFLLRVALNNSFGINLTPQYSFSNDIAGKKVVVYGAGRCGKDYVNNIKIRKDCKMVAWVDKGLVGNTIMDVLIASPERMKELEFDQCIIAVVNEELAKKIRLEIEEYIEPSKIVWEKPIVTNSWQAKFNFVD